MKANKTKVIAVSVVLVLLASAMFTVMSIFNNKVYATGVNLNETTEASPTISPTPTPTPSPSPSPSPSTAPTPSPTQNVEMPKTGDGDDFIIYGVIGVLLVVGIVTFVRIKSV